MEFNFNKIRHRNERLYLILSFIIILIILITTNLFNGFIYAILFLLWIIFNIIILQRKYLGNALRVSDKHFYRVNIIVDNLCKKIRIKKPNIYITYDPYPNAFAFGFIHPYNIVLNSSLVENLSEDELETVIAHELGHIYFKHTKILTIFNTMSNDIFYKFFLQLILIGFWYRATEYTCDNFSLILTKNPQAIISSLIKIYISIKHEEKIDEEQILEQFKMSKKDLFSILGELSETHPYFVKRVNNIIEQYKKLGYEYFKRGSNIYCVNCGKKIDPNSKYCIYCGYLISY